LHDFHAHQAGILAAPLVPQNPPPEDHDHAVDNAAAKPSGSARSPAPLEVPSSPSSCIPMQYLGIPSDTKYEHQAAFAPMYPDPLDPSTQITLMR
jgi:hypothetical protein